jgi:hypothetical protein
MRVECRASLAPRGARHSGGDRQMGHERKLKRRDSAPKRCKMHGETPTAHAHRRVAVGARRWVFCRHYRRGLCVFRLRGLGRRGAAARFSRRRHPRGVKLYRLDGHLELKKWDIQGSLLFFEAPKETGVAASIRRQMTQTYWDGLLLESFPTIWRGS